MKKVLLWALVVAVLATSAACARRRVIKVKHVHIHVMQSVQHASVA